MRFTVFGKPTGKARPRVAGRHAYTPGRTRAYEALVQAAFLENNPDVTPLHGPVQVDILAFYPIPKSCCKALQVRMQNNEVAPTVKPDWDNVGKIVCDALNGLAWKDDAQIVDAHVVKRYGVTPMVCVKIEEAGHENH
ncbi:MAG: RusA family crossover junction endodeoxyribonuclease [Candidatus Limiplasma sp.]|nr:RusA family crossover junction endodeoxyribonuclease [Candidatus Limiplasma sp.]